VPLPPPPPQALVERIYNPEGTGIPREGFVLWAPAFRHNGWIAMDSGQERANTTRALVVGDLVGSPTSCPRPVLLCGNIQAVCTRMARLYCFAGKGF